METVMVQMEMVMVVTDKQVMVKQEMVNSLVVRVI